jgi:peptidoglycan L-alanyl-D-glutamate endopeptidase CwlK
MLSPASQTMLRSAHKDLARLARAVAAKGVAFRVICAYRNKHDQERAFQLGMSKVRFGQSAHNYRPSLAIDVVPGWSGSVKWSDLKAFDTVGRAFVATAKELNIPIRWGADWDRDGSITDERFVDRPHIELHPWRSYAGVAK